jgi:tetratricopeptide (TPR) repeat protein
VSGRSKGLIGGATALLILLTAAPAENAQQPSHHPDGLAPPVTSVLDVPEGLRTGAAIERAILGQAWDRAEALLISEVDRRPRDAKLLMLVARVFFLNHKPLNSAIALKKADAIRHLDPSERLLLAMSYVAMHQGDWARTELDRLATEDPQNVTYMYWLGRLDYDKSQFTTAIARFKEVVARNPGHVRGWDNLGLCYEAVNQVTEAVSAYETAVRANRSSLTPSPWPPLNFGMLLRRSGNFERAEALLAEAIRYDGSLAQAHYELGVLLEAKGEVASAIISLQRAVEANAAYAEPYYALGRIYRRDGRPVEADAALANFRRLRNGQASMQP